MKDPLKEQINDLPTESGVYLFFNDKEELLYIGKAAVLRQRVRQYFQKGYAPHNPASRAMINEITDIQWETTGSEIEALVREAQLIKERNPKYNITMRDDKSYFWVVFSNDDFPRIRLTHQPFDFTTGKPTEPNARYEAIGPFTDGAALKKTLKVLRAIFPYCTCKNNHKRACLNAQMERCPGFCCIAADVTMEQQKAYRSSIRAIRRVLMGRSQIVLTDLTKEMHSATKQQQFERAADLRDVAQALQTTLDHAHVLGSPIVVRPRQRETALTELKTLLNLKNIPHRIEAYDIANLRSDAPTASMVVAINGENSPADYRQFHIKSKVPNDVAALSEALHRRLRHDEWPLPDIIMMDGGKAQLNAALKTLDQHSLTKRPAVIALAKREEELYREANDEVLLLKNINSEAAYLLQSLRDEAHRFARRLHHKKRSSDLFAP